MAQTENISVNEQAPVQTNDGYEPKGLAKVLNRFFHFKENGGTMKGEILAGISIFLVSVTLLFMNMRVIASSLSLDNAGYVGVYLAATIASFVGTLLLGLFARLPLVMTSSLSLTNSFIAMIGINEGLTYQNLLAITFLSAIISVAIALIPQVRSFVYKMIPDPVRKALPVGIGLFVVGYGLSDIGIIGGTGLLNVNDISVYGDKNSAYMLGAVAAIIVILAAIVFVKIKEWSRAPIILALGLGFVVFFVLSLIVGFSSVFSVNRAYIMIGAENMYSISLGFSGIDIGSVFTQGFDFSACGGNAWKVIIFGVLTGVIMPLAEGDGNTQRVSLYNTSLLADEKNVTRVWACTGLANAVGSIFGALPVTVSKASDAGAHDGGKSGLTSVVTSLGFLLSMFTWVCFALFATYTYTVSDYGHATSNSFAEYAKAIFAINDAALIVLGLFSLKGIGAIDVKKLDELIPFALTALVTAFASNIVYGVAAGTIAYALIKLLSLKSEEIKGVGIPTYCMAGVSLITMLLI